MPYSDAQLERIFDRTDGRCHLCHGNLYFDDYAAPVAYGGWEVEHSRPRSRGGTDHSNNLYAACVSCNRSKGTRSAASYRRERGLNGPPTPKTEYGLFDVFALGLLSLGVLTWLNAIAQPAVPASRMDPHQEWPAHFTT